jgi:polyribonucleotide nucleotidyltransferase
MAPKRVDQVSDIVKEGDKVKVKLLGFDQRGKVRLSMKQVDQETGKEISEDKGGEEE